MSVDEWQIELDVDLTNPGQFFACCGLFELASRCEPAALARFDGGKFCLRMRSMDLPALMSIATKVPITPLDPNDPAASPLRLGDPIGLTLDWWCDPFGGGDLKVWAGSMHNARIAVAMQAASSAAAELEPERVLNYSTVVFEPERPTKKVEPFYFDCRRGDNAFAIDVGFSPNDLRMTTTAHPAVEFLCLIGLQRFRPGRTDRRRVFIYTAWSRWRSAVVAAAEVAGLGGSDGDPRFRFENVFRTDQKKHKAFGSATRLEINNDHD